MRDRSSFAGMLGIIRYNWPFYAGAISVVIIWALFLTDPFWQSGLLVLLFPLWFLVGSSLVSHWVYDRSPLYRWQWLGPVIDPGQVDEALICVAGFDEVSADLARAYPGIQFQVLDHYDRKVMTEPSIHRARRAHPPGPESLTGPGHKWPQVRTDLVIAPLSIHEFRLPIERTAWFRQARRALREGGRIVLVEHGRDLANFIAFGPGFLHFHSFATWEKAWTEAGLSLERHFKITPFVQIIVLQ